MKYGRKESCPQEQNFFFYHSSKYTTLVFILLNDPRGRSSELMGIGLAALATAIVY